MLDVGHWATCAALCHNIPYTTFALPALGGNTQFKLNFVKTHAGTGMTNNLAVGNSAADANNHELACWLITLSRSINENVSHLQ